MPFQTTFLNNVRLKPFPVFDFYEGFSSKPGLKSRVEFYFWQSLFNLIFYYLQFLKWIDSVTKATGVFWLTDRIVRRTTKWRTADNLSPDDQRFQLWQILLVLAVPPIPMLVTLANQVRVSINFI